MWKVTVLSAGLCVGFVEPALARQPPAPAPLVAMRKAFAAAVSANNQNAAAALTSIPLKNVVFKAPPRLDRAGFAKLFKSYRDMAACIKTGPLEHQGPDWFVNCDGNVLHFGLRGRRWLHTEYENINE